MRPEGNSLDLNNLPEDPYTRDVTHDSGDTSNSSPPGRKSGGGREEKEEAGKVYECRFCSLKFCKSQALGGHMNRHRQERETETLNKARQLVFSNDLTPPPPHLGYVSSGQTVPHGGGYHQPPTSINTNTNDTSLPFQSIYPSNSRMFSQPLLPYPSIPANSYYVGTSGGTYYTCVGAPVAAASGVGGVCDGDPDLSLQNQVEGRNWGGR